MQDGESVFHGCGNCLRARGHIELGEDARQVKSHRPFRHSKNLADFPVRFAVFDPIQDGHFARRQFFDAFFRRRGIFPCRSHEGEVQVMSEILHELGVPLSIDILPFLQRNRMWQDRKPGRLNWW